MPFSTSGNVMMKVTSNRKLRSISGVRLISLRCFIEEMYALAFTAAPYFTP
jgi:hypothetical protein